MDEVLDLLFGFSYRHLLLFEFHIFFLFLSGIRPMCVVSARFSLLLGVDIGLRRAQADLCTRACPYLLEVL